MTDIGLTHFATRAAALRFERARRRGLANEAEECKQRLDLNLNLLCQTFQALLDDGVAKDAIAEALAGLMDAIVNADYAACKTIDEAGEHYKVLDMREAAALLAKVRA